MDDIEHENKERKRSEGREMKDELSFYMFVRITGFATGIWMGHG